MFSFGNRGGHDWRSAFKQLTDQLAVLVAPVNEEDQVIALFGSLPQYLTLVTALEARGDDLTVGYVQ